MWGWEGAEGSLASKEEEERSRATSSKTDEAAFSSQIFLYNIHHIKFSNIYIEY